MRTPRRVIRVQAILVLAALLTTALALMLGSFTVPPADLLRVLLGQGTRQQTMVVMQWRAPRAVAALGFGAALALGGAIFQSLTRNPLGSPDIVGFSTGSFTGVLVVMLFGGTGFGALAGGALAGGLATALVIYLLAFRGGAPGFRLIIMGIAVSALLTSVNQWIVVKAESDFALRAGVWGAGSLNALRWPQVWPALVVLAALLLGLRCASPTLARLELGDRLAAALGARVAAGRLCLIALGVGFTAVVTAITGPIAFIALTAPQIARRLVGSGSANLVTPALVGALLLGLSDLVAQHLLATNPLPVGAVTVTLGGLYLIWLVVRETARH